MMRGVIKRNVDAIVGGVYSPRQDLTSLQIDLGAICTPYLRISIFSNMPTLRRAILPFDFTNCEIP